jgi:hypothetical protein
VPIFLERFILPVFAAVVVLLALTNPMKFDTTQRITGVLALLFAAYFVAHTAHKHGKSAPNVSDDTSISKPEVPQQTAVFIQGQIEALPIHIPPASTAHIVRLYPQYKPQTEVENWGFYDVSSPVDKERIWPSNSEAVATSKMPGGWIYRCEVSNHGPTLVQDIAIKFHIDFGTKEKDKPAQYSAEHTVIVTPLDPGKSLVFYMVNHCNLTANTIIPETATAQVFGESGRREIQLKRLYRNPIEPIMIFFPSTYRWQGVPFFPPLEHEPKSQNSN